MPRDICAIIVTWNSGKEINRILPAVTSQVKSVVVVDNGSTPENLQTLREVISPFKNITLIKNPRNEGIAHALNRGAEFAAGRGYEWILTLDDNGKPGPDMVKTMLAAYHELPDSEQSKTAIIAPNYNTLKGRVYEGNIPFFVPTTIASGQLVKVAAWKKVGPYKEDFFIACVDHEYCFRMLRSGYKTLLVPSCFLEATAGPKPVLHSILGRKFVVPNYHPDRYYYTFRNSVYLYKTYWRYVPGWILENIISSVATYAKILFFEDQKLKKTALIIRGCFDGIRNKFGKIS